MSEHHEHRHLARGSGAGASVDEALFNAIAGLTDPQGHTTRVRLIGLAPTSGLDPALFVGPKGQTPPPPEP